MGYDVLPQTESQVSDDCDSAEQELIISFNKLNEIGKKGALKRIKELTLLLVYTEQL